MNLLQLVSTFIRPKRNTGGKLEALVECFYLLFIRQPLKANSSSASIIEAPAITQASRLRFRTIPVPSWQWMKRRFSSLISAINHRANSSVRYTYNDEQRVTQLTWFHSNQVLSFDSTGSIKFRFDLIGSFVSKAQEHEKKSQSRYQFMTLILLIFNLI